MKIFRGFLLVVLLMGFGIVEAYMYANTLQQKQYAEFLALSSRLGDELTALESAISIGDQKLYDENQKKLTAIVDEIAKLEPEQNLTKLAKEYSKSLVEQKESISEAIILQSAYRQLQTELNALPEQVTNDNVEEYLRQLKEIYTKYGEAISVVDFTSNTELQKSIEETIALITDVAGKGADCIDACYKTSYPPLQTRLNAASNLESLGAAPITLDSSALRAEINKLKE